MKIILKIGIFILNIIYSILKLFPVQNKITFIKAPFVYGLRGYDIKLALNKMLKIIFFNLKKIILKRIFLIKK